MAKSIGIDLGTTNSVACLYTTEPQIILNRENDRLTPSVVALKRGKKTGDSIVIGKIAWDYAKLAGTDFLYSIKRLIGRPYSDPAVQKVARTVTYVLKESPDGQEDVSRVTLGDQDYAPQEISAMVLKKLKEDAEFRLGDTVDSAVITVPAYFSERQKHATREAGLKAGLKVKKIIDEPSAAAIAYGIDQDSDEDKMVLVFDLGGGTFDVSILLIYGGVFSQMDNEGDMWLGGDDFDRVIMDNVIHYVETEYELENVAQNPAFMHDLRKKAREAKEILSSQDSAEILITDSLKDEDDLPIAVEYEITKGEFERMLEPFAQRARECVEKALEEANLEKDEIDAVLLVGGSSTIPKFQKTMEEFFGPEKIMRNIDPMTCVAVGAGILAKNVTFIACPECNHENPMSAEKCEKCGQGLVLEREDAKQVENLARTPKPYGIEVEGDVFEEIIPKNEVYPMEDPQLKEFRTTMSNQRLIKVPVLEGNSAKASENELMGTIWFYDLPPNLPEGTSVEISMGLDGDGIFTIGCRVQGTDWKRQQTLMHGGWENPVLDEAMSAHIELMRQGASGEEAGEAERHIQGIENAVEQGDRQSALGHLEELKRLRQARDMEQIDSGEVDRDAWRIPVENIMQIGKTNLDRVRPILPDGDPKVAAFESWCERARRALDSNDAVNGPGLSDTGKDLVFEMPLVGELVLAAILINNPSLNPAVTTRLEQARQELFASIDRRNTNDITSALEAFRAALNEALELHGQTAGAGPVDVKTLLGKK